MINVDTQSLACRCALDLPGTDRPNMTWELQLQLQQPSTPQKAQGPTSHARSTAPGFWHAGVRWVCPAQTGPRRGLPLPLPPALLRSLRHQRGRQGHGQVHPLPQGLPRQLSAPGGQTPWGLQALQGTGRMFATKLLVAATPSAASSSHAHLLAEVASARACLASAAPKPSMPTACPWGPIASGPASPTRCGLNLLNVKRIVGLGDWGELGPVE